MLNKIGIGASKSGSTQAKRKWGERGFLFSVWLIPVTLFFVTYVYVNFNSIIMSFKSINNDNFEYTWTGFNNFKTFWELVTEDPSLKYAIANGAMAYFVNLFINTPLQILVAFFVYKKVYGTEFFKIIMFLPQIIASVVWIMLFRYFCDYGMPEIFKLLGAEPVFLLDKDATIGFYMMLLYSSWIGLGGAMLVYVGTMSRIPDSVVEAGKLDGMTMMGEFIYTVVPLIFPILSVSLVTTVPSIFTNQLQIHGFFKDTAGPRLYTIGYWLFVQVIGTEMAHVSRYPIAAAGGIMITLIAAPLTFGMRWLMNKLDPEVTY